MRKELLTPANESHSYTTSFAISLVKDTRYYFFSGIDYDVNKISGTKNVPNDADVNRTLDGHVMTQATHF